MLILGAGMAGCLAAIINQSSIIWEPKKYDDMNFHKAVLRFRTPQIGDAIGVKFKKITVYKGIWHRKQAVNLSPRYINLYSRKVSDIISERSICNLQNEERWIAPSDFHDILIGQCKNRIFWGTPTENIFANAMELSQPIITTLPIFVPAKEFSYDLKIENNISKIFVTRLKINGCDIYQTYYYTDPDLLPYRASLTKDILIIESRWEIKSEDIYEVLRSFGLTGIDYEIEINNYEQPNGKMTKIDESKRRQIIFELTHKFNIYSLGRFAVWRNLVLDEVYDDIFKIRRMINEDNYGKLRIEHES